MNNKGFAISGVLYPLFILFLVLILGVVGTLSAAKAVLDANKRDVETRLNLGRIDHVDVLIIGGGGSGASTHGEHKGGGGGAGGLVFIPNYQVPIYSAVSIFVGAGGEAKPDSEDDTALRSPGETGQNSVFGELIALGGGGGRRSNSAAAQLGDGGSGGGGHYTRDGGLGLQRTSMTGGFGNPGGSQSSSSMGYGGGGAGTPGMNDGSSPSDGRVQLGRNAGGQGLYEVIVEGIVYNFNEMFGNYGIGHFVEDELWFAGGGGGGSNASSHSAYGAGGYGGGGRGAFSNQGVSTPAWEIDSPKGEDGMPSTGGGGGGARGGESGAGGSGVVIVRYRGEQKAVGGDVYFHNGYTIHVFSETGGHLFRMIG